MKPGKSLIDRNLQINQPLGVGYFVNNDIETMPLEHQRATRLITKVQLEPGRREFVTIPHSGSRHLRDPRPGIYFLESKEDGAVFLAPHGAPAREGVERVQQRRRQEYLRIVRQLERHLS